MDFNKLEPRLFPAFLAAARTLNFTAAAKEVALTQSGISQHIARLEADIGAQLFQRVNRSVVLTDAGRQLIAYVNDYADRHQAFLSDIHASARQLAGLVSYAMPASCLLSPHLAQMLERRREHPGIELKINVATVPKIHRMVLEGKVDFGFVTRKVANGALTFTAFCEEEYVLVGADRALVADAAAFSGDAPLVAYPGVDDCLEAWWSHHAPRRQRPTFRRVATINSIEGAITLVRSGAGVTFMPRHCVEPYLTQGLSIGPGRATKPAMNQIYIITFANGRPARRVQQVIDWFLEIA